MKIKLIISLLIVIAAFTVISSCKKGEDDPFISFRSRKARVVGEWKIVSGKGARTETGPDAANASWEQQGESYTETDTGGVHVYKRITNYKIEKDGTFSFVDSYDGDVTRREGTWDFEGGVGDAKKKERLIMFYEQHAIPTWGTFFINSNYVNQSWELKELRHKKMVWYRQLSYSYPDGRSGSVEEEIVFEPK